MGSKFYGFCKGLVYTPLQLVFPAKVIGRENMPENGRLITVSNHLSWIDIPLLGVHLRGYRHFIAKKEIGKNPIVRKLALGLGVIFIDRGRADISAIRESVRALKNDESLSIFPEGTRNKTDDTLQQIKGGVTMLALKGNAPIVPVLIHAKARPFRKSYLYVGPPFELTEFSGRRLDADTLAAAAEVVARHMAQAKDYLDDYVAGKRWLAERREKKTRKKEQRRANRQANSDYRKLLKEKRDGKVR